MRAIQVWRWQQTSSGTPRPDSRLLAVPPPLIDRVFAGLYAAWSASGGNGLPAPAIIETDVDPASIGAGGRYPPIPIDPASWPTRSFPGFGTVGPGAGMNAGGASPAPQPGAPELERFTAEELVTMGTCPDCASVVLFEKMPAPFTYRCLTVHDQTCPEWAKIQAEAAEARRRVTGDNPE